MSDKENLILNNNDNINPVDKIVKIFMSCTSEQTKDGSIIDPLISEFESLKMLKKDITPITKKVTKAIVSNKDIDSENKITMLSCLQTAYTTVEKKKGLESSSFKKGLEQKRIKKMQDEIKACQNNLSGVSNCRSM